MRRVPKIVCLIFLFLFLVWFSYNTTFIDDRKYAQAVYVYTKNPTPENEAILRGERQRVNMLRTREAAAGDLIGTVFLFGLWQIYGLTTKRLRRSS
jgi:hypothetical protein